MLRAGLSRRGAAATQRLHRANLLVTVGPSGSGKSTLVTKFVAEFPQALGYSVSHTTRGPRPGEVEGEHYHFVDAATFARLRDREQAFLESQTVHGNSYGTSKAAVRTVLATGKCVALDLDIRGAKAVRAVAPAPGAPLLSVQPPPDDGTAVPPTTSTPEESWSSRIVFVRPPSLAVLERRLRARNTETEDRLRTRLANAEAEMAWWAAHQHFFDATFVNDDLDECYAAFRAYACANLRSLASLPQGEEG
jgi:guanylate kinase